MTSSTTTTTTIEVETCGGGAARVLLNGTPVGRILRQASAEGVAQWLEGALQDILGAGVRNDEGPASTSVGSLPDRDAPAAYVEGRYTPDASAVELGRDLLEAYAQEHHGGRSILRTPPRRDPPPE